MIVELRKQTTASVELLHALFEWGKAQLQGVKVNSADFNPKLVVGRTVSLLSQQAALKNISITDYLPDYFLIHADTDHFELVIRNLISNAIKFSYEGSEIEVNAQLPSSKKEIVFSVQDRGIGINKAQQEVFRTGNLPVSFGTRKEKGSGLGLLLAKDFIKANHGRIWLESQEGKGTTFYVALPAA
jgi:signal transduction histidine kinase